ncbi:MAG: SGNH/GDSL hydrolase family protein [Phycisphaeraceae bacterium]
MALLLSLLGGCAGAPAGGTSFAGFDQRARAGEALNVVFFGGSLTWGANASDPNVTSYRGLLAQHLRQAYPLARWRFHDAAIGGTNSQLAAFRLGRDVLDHQPDLIFLDFTANDDLLWTDAQKLAAFESLVRRIITEARCPVVMMILPFRDHVEKYEVEALKRREAHLRIAQAYHVPVADAVTLVRDAVRNGADPARLWPFDRVHPGDEGYELFAQAGWAAMQGAIAEQQVCAAPPTMLHGQAYMHTARVPVASLPLPAGWQTDRVNVNGAFFDMLPSRWLDSIVVARRGDEPQPLEYRFHGGMVAVLGEKTTRSGKFRAMIDGQYVMSQSADQAAQPKLFDASSIRFGGNVLLFEVLATGLDPAVSHTVRIEPIYDSDKAQELRLSAICVAGPVAASNDVLAK